MRARVAWGFAGLAVVVAIAVGCMSSSNKPVADSNSTQDHVVPNAGSLEPVAEPESVVEVDVVQPPPCTPPEDKPKVPKCDDHSEDYAQRCQKAVYHPSPRGLLMGERRYTNDDLPPGT